MLCFLLCGLVAEMSAVSFKLGPLGRVPTFVRKIVNRSSANKRNEASATEAQRKSSYPIKNIKSPKHPLYPVVSEMRQNLAQLREEPNTELQLDVQSNEYLDKIIEYYYQEFLNRCAQYTRRKQYAPLKDTIVNECTDVCNELTASLKELSYEVRFMFSGHHNINIQEEQFVLHLPPHITSQGHLMELQSDIDNYIQQIPPDEVS